jgi:hypothetical protein
MDNYTFISANFNYSLEIFVKKRKIIDKKDFLLKTNTVGPK